MVSAEQILNVARNQEVDLIGLSGLITPSLDEMVHVAGEMQRQGMKVPLLIGGATTSRVHTAVKIAPSYEHGVIHVPDASKAVGVVSKLIDAEARSELVASTSAAYAQLRTDREQRQSPSTLLPLAEAREHRQALDWSRYQPPPPRQTGVQVFDAVSLEELRRHIDWTPFFHTWRLKGSYPSILERKEVGAEARRLLADVEALLDTVIAEGSLTARAAVGIWPANAVGDDLEIYADPERREVIGTARYLRQQRRRGSDGFCHCLADLVAPRATELRDHVGAFVVSTGFGATELAADYEARGDDYSAIMVKALADRLAEAGAEWLHALVRRELWGYAADEKLDNEALIREEYSGIRPAPGYPACPDHSEKTLIFDLLAAEDNTGVSLTENCAMLPAAAVSGWYFSHPRSKYFGVGKLGRDQVADYARRKGFSVAEVERWLAPNLGYNSQGKTT